MGSICGTVLWSVSYTHLQAGLHYATEGWTYPLDDFINNPEMTPPEWDFNDFFGGLKQGGNFSGKQHSISIQSETSLLAYRKDLLSENGIDVPQTMKELEAAAPVSYTHLG